MSAPRRTRLVLVGPGHTHLEILRRLILHPLPDLDLTVVSPNQRHHYSGMVPGFLYGAYTEEEISVSVTDLVEGARGRTVLAAATGLDPQARQVRLADGSRLEYDLVSIAVGSTTAGFDRPEIAEHASLVKPLERVVELREDLQRLARSKADSRAGHGVQAPVAVVGGGAAGVEVALAVHTLLAGGDGRGSDSGAAGSRSAGSSGCPVALYESGDQPLSGFAPRFRRRVLEVLQRRGIATRTGAEVARVEKDALVLADGTRHLARRTIWLTGAVAYPWLQDSGLPVDDRGFFRVDRSLRSVGDSRVFAAGDCATLEAAPGTPKAGVYAVRHGPVLWQSLRATLAGETADTFPEYHPQDDFLALLNTADGRALLRWNRWVTHGRHAWWLKDWIDRRFLRRYQRLTE